MSWHRVDVMYTLRTNLGLVYSFKTTSTTVLVEFDEQPQSYEALEAAVRAAIPHKIRWVSNVQVLSTDGPYPTRDDAWAMRNATPQHADRPTPDKPPPDTRPRGRCNVCEQPIILPPGEPLCADCAALSPEERHEKARQVAEWFREVDEENAAKQAMDRLIDLAIQERPDWVREIERAMEDAFKNYQYPIPDSILRGYVRKYLGFSSPFRG